MKSFRIIGTQITPLIRVSTAAILRPGFAASPNPYYQYETWCFSKDSKQKSFQVIHGTDGGVRFYLMTKAIKVHRHIVNNLKNRKEAK